MSQGPNSSGAAEMLEELLRSFVGAALRNQWSSMPVILTKDSDGKTVTAKMAVKALQRMQDGSVRPVELPLMMDAPIHFMSGGNVSHSFPLKEGNEGFMVFANRSFETWREKGDPQKPVEYEPNRLSDGMFVPGLKSKPKEMPDINTEAAEQRSDDGKNRQIAHPKNGFKSSVNNGKQVLDVNAVSGAVEAVGKTVTMAAGETKPGRAPNAPNTTDRDLNDQLKGALARLGQVEKSLHGLFDVSSRMREIVQTQIPGVAVLAPILNGAPGGLDAMVGAIEGKAAAYLQTQAQQALAMFMNPTFGAVASLLNGGIEAQIAGLRAQIESLVASNPAIAAIDTLQRQVDAVLTRGASAEVTAAQLKPFTDEIAALTRANPAVAVVQGLKDQLQKLLSQAGPGLNFLEPQKRLAQGQTKSLHLSE